jgi:hypothetical protein
MPAWADLLPFLAAVIGALSGFGGHLIAARRKSPGMQKLVYDAVNDITKHYSKALAEQTAEVHSLRDEVADLRTTIEKQNGEISELNDHIIDLSAALEKHGVAPPPRRRRNGAG